MYCTPCARLMKSITPNTSVSPAAIRNKSTPSCSPLSTCTRTRVVFMAPCKSCRNANARHPGRRAQALGRDDSRQFGASVMKPTAASLHRAVLGVRVGVVLEYLLVDLG